MSDLTMLSVLSSVRHLGTCWPLEWAFFSISMFFLHSSDSFSYLWRYRHGFTGSHRCDLCKLSWEKMRSTRTPAEGGEKTTLHWQSTNKSVLKVTLGLVVIICSMEINEHLSPQSLSHTAHSYKFLTAAQAFLRRHTVWIYLKTFTKYFKEIQNVHESLIIWDAHFQLNLRLKRRDDLVLLP